MWLIAASRMFQLCREMVIFQKRNRFWAQLGFAPGTSCTRSRNHTTKPLSRLKTYNWPMTTDQSTKNPLTMLINKEFFLEMYMCCNNSHTQHPQFTKKKSIFGLNRDLNPGPLAPKARIIPLDHWASYVPISLVWIYSMDVNNSKVFCLEPVLLSHLIRNASIAQWQSVGLVNQRSWVQSSLEATCFSFVC